MMIEYYYVQPYDPQLLKNCLKALHSIARLNHHDIINDLIVNEGQNILMTLSFKLLEESVLTLDFQQCLLHAFAIMEKLSTLHESIHETVVNLCLTFLERVLNPEPEDPLHNPNFLICGIDFLWESMVWNEDCLCKFTSEGGVYKLLDIVHKCALPVKIVTLGVLVDMCDIGFCIPHLITWRNNGKKLLPLLLELFRLENLRMGVKSDSHGIISDMELPLMGHQQWYDTYDVDKDSNTSPATVDLLGSCRPKVYAIINLLNNRHEARVIVSNDHYQLYNPNSLSTIDKITLLLAENFLALKLGEVWVEVSRDIDKSGIRPLAFDEEFMTHLKRRFLKWSQHIQISQEKLLEKELIQEYNNEMSLYCILRESKLVESLKALRELDYIARTTERMFRLTSKMKHCNDIESTKYVSEDGAYRTTYMHKLKVTPVFLQTVSIQSDIIPDPNATPIPSLVSLIDDCVMDCKCDNDAVASDK